MKQLRVGYYVSLAFLLLMGLSTGRREYYLIGAALLLLLCYSLALNLWTYFSFSYVQEISSSTVIKGDAPVLKIGIYNEKPFPFTMMRIMVQTPVPSEKVELAFNLDPSSNIYYDIPLNCPYRGVYKVGMTTLEICDVFGLLRMRFDLRKLPYYRQKQLIIYPRLVQLPALPAALLDAKRPGGGAQRITEEGEGFSDTRQYRYGDPFKRIHRVLSMRKRELFVKRYDAPTETAAIIALDTAVERYSGEALLQYADIASECATAIAHYCLRGGFVVEVCGSDDLPPPTEGKSGADFSALYDHLAIMPFESKGDICDMIERECHRHPNLKAVYVITPHGSIRLAEVLSRLAGDGCSVKCITPVVEKSVRSEVRSAQFASGITSAIISGCDEIPVILSEIA